MRLVALVFCLALPLAAQGPVNLNFQDIGPEGKPTGWGWASSSTYSIATVDNCRLPGSRCVMVRDQGETIPRGSVYIMQSFDATDLRGKQVRYRASLRREARISGAQLFLRVDRPSGVGFSDYSQDQMIDSPDWTVGEIAGKIDTDAVRVTIGLIFHGYGPAYFADPEFEIIGN